VRKAILNMAKYYYSKMILHIQIPSIRDSQIDASAKIGHRSNLINTKVGRYSYCGNNSSFTNVEIGSFCSIASFCAIGGGMHPQIYVSTSPIFYEPNNIFKHHGLISTELEKKNSCVPSTFIGNDVWIGEACFIKAGILVGHGAIIGAHSVVTHNIPSYAIVAGVPAKIIRYRFEQQIIDYLLKIEWWNWSESELVKYKQYFGDPIELIKYYRRNEEREKT
jgi:acetyltransferase-like isoleucine patch superfamily enzyme